MPDIFLSATWHNDASLGWKESSTAARSLDRTVVAPFCHAVCLYHNMSPCWLDLQPCTHYSFSCTLLSITAIYNIVSQRQMSGRTDSDFSPASNVVPITVEPTQNSSSKGVCCQSNWDPTTDLLLHLQAMRERHRQTDGQGETGSDFHTRTLVLGLSIVWLIKKNKRGTSDEGIVKRCRQGVWCGRVCINGKETSGRPCTQCIKLLKEVHDQNRFTIKM